MRIIETYSHFNGLEHLLIHKRSLWDEIQQVIEQVRSIHAGGSSGIDEVEAARQFKSLFKSREWREGELSNLVKDRVALGFQAGEYAFAKHLALYVQDEIDVGIEILPTMSLQRVTTNESGNGRGVPAVPLVMIGVAP